MAFAGACSAPDNQGIIYTCSPYKQHAHARTHRIEGAPVNKRSTILTAIALASVSALAATPAAFADGGASEGNTQLGLFLGILIVVASGIIMSFTNRHFKKKSQSNQRKNSSKKKSSGSNGGAKNKDKKRSNKKAAQSRAKNRK